MPASPERPPQDRRGLRWLRNAAIATLALVFAQPACFTSAVWRDDRSHDQVWRAETPQMRAFRAQNAAGEFLVQLPPQAMATLRSMQPALPPGEPWLRVRPLEHGATVATVLALAGDRNGDLHPELAIVDDPTGDGRTVRFQAYSFGGTSHPLHEVFRALPGVARTDLFSLFRSYSLDVPCAIQAEFAPPDDLGAELLDFRCSEERILDDGTHVVKRLALTPLAVLGDVLMLPFELWFLIATW